jgi:hypothetical protein
MMNENKVIDLVNAAGYKFEKMDSKFSRYDAFDAESGVMLEIKCRKKHYDDTLLEKMKYDWNKQFAIENDFEFIYAVSMPVSEGEKIYLFDPVEMETEEDYDFGWHTKKLPAKTEFGGSNWIDKEVGYLHIKDAMLTIQEKPKH